MKDKIQEIVRDENTGAFIERFRDMTAEEKAVRAADEKEFQETAYIDRRAAAYPPIGDQLDAILKGFQELQKQGTELPADLTVVIEKWQQTKDENPKE